MCKHKIDKTAYTRVSQKIKGKKPASCLSCACVHACVCKHKTRQDCLHTRLVHACVSSYVYAAMCQQPFFFKRNNGTVPVSCARVCKVSMCKLCSFLSILHSVLQLFRTLRREHKYKARTHIEGKKNRPAQRGPCPLEKKKPAAHECLAL